MRGPRLQTAHVSSQGLVIEPAAGPGSQHLHLERPSLAAALSGVLPVHEVHCDPGPCRNVCEPKDCLSDLYTLTKVNERNRICVFGAREGAPLNS